MSGGETVDGLACTMEQCTIQYLQGPNTATAVILGAPQCSVIGPGEFVQASQSSGGPSGCTCIAVQGPSEHAVICDMYIYEWTWGVDFSQPSTHEGAQYTHITNCEIICWQTALNLRPPAGTTSTTAGIKVAGCVLAKASDSNDAHAIVFIDLNGAPSNTQLNDISLLDCTVFSMAPTAALQYGLQITGGSNIKIIGGTYSNNGSSGGAGIAITGPCTDVQIIGANLQPSYPSSPNVHAQQYALLIASSAVVPGPILVSGCDMTGYSASPVSVAGTPTELLISSCPGYNDRNTALIATSAMLTSGINAATLSTPYFGPSVFTFSNSTPLSVQVFGQTLTMSFGVIFLPSPYDSIRFTTTAPATFTWIGK